MKYLSALSVFVLCVYAMVGTIVSGNAHGNSLAWFLGGVAIISLAGATVLTYLFNS